MRLSAIAIESPSAFAGGNSAVHNFGETMNQQKMETEAASRMREMARERSRWEDNGSVVSFRNDGFSR